MKSGDSDHRLMMIARFGLDYRTRQNMRRTAPMQIDRERLATVMFDCDDSQSGDCIGDLIDMKWDSLAVCRTAVSAVLADIEAQGFVVVPREPTEAMVRSGGAAFDYPSLYMGGSSETGKRKARSIWSAMIDAGMGEG